MEDLVKYGCQNGHVANPVQAVGGSSVEQAIHRLEVDAEIVLFEVLPMIDGREFKAADSDFEDALRSTLGQGNRR